MCSTAAQRIAEIGRAIDDLSTRSGGDAGAAAEDTGPVVARLAELWALLAELDPEVARRLAGYQNLSALTDLWPRLNQEHSAHYAGHLTDGRSWPSGRQKGPSLRPISAGAARPSSAADYLHLKRGADFRVQPHRDLVRPDGLDRIADLDLAAVELGTARVLDRRGDV